MSPEEQAEWKATVVACLRQLHRDGYRVDLLTDDRALLALEGESPYLFERNPGAELVPWEFLREEIERLWKTTN